MPNWKKVIVSGSDAVLNSLNVTNGVTGSLFGTGSWAVRAQSASIADNAVTASRALQANTASYAVFAATATSATSAGSATSASYATFAATATSASFAPTPTNVFVQGGNNFGTTAIIGTNDAQGLQLETNGTVAMTINSNSSVGIGTSVIYSALDIFSKNISWGESITIFPASTGYSTIAFRVTGSGMSSTTGTWGIGKESAIGGNTTTEYFQVVKNGLTGGSLYRADALQAWNPNGNSSFGFNVGIGTITPLAKLDVRGNSLFYTSGADTFLTIQGNSSFDPVLEFKSDQGPITGEGFQMWYTNDVGNMRFATTYPNDNASIHFHTRTGASKSTSNERLTILGGGNIGINTTTPTNRLQVVGGVTATSFTGSLLGNASTATSASYVTFAATASSADTFIVRGNIGVGTTIASYPIHVKTATVYHITAEQSSSNPADTSAYATFYILNNATASGQIRGYFGAGGSGVSNSGMQNYVYAGSQTNHGFRIFTNDNTKVTVQADGNVGIGVLSPSEKLEIAGIAKISLNQNALTRLIISNTTAGAGSYIETSYTSDSSAGAAAVGKYSSTTTTYKIVAASNTYLYNATAGDIAILNDFSGGNIKLAAGGSTTAQMFISASGNVGIGVTTPTNLLHTAGASATPSLRLGSVSAGYHWDIGRENATTGDFVFNNANGGSTSERVRITVGGNVGIGTTSPTEKLQIQSGSVFVGGALNSTPITTGTQYKIKMGNQYWNSTKGTSGSIKLELYSTGDGDTYGLGVSNAELEIQSQVNIGFYAGGSTTRTLRMFIDGTNGNVGIGTSTANNKLHIYDTVGAPHFAIQNPTANSYSQIGFIGDTKSAYIFKGNSTYSSYGGANALNLYTDPSGGPISFHPGAANNSVTFATSGNVGINTTAPSAKLEVAGYTFLRTDTNEAHNWFPYTDGSVYISCVTGSSIFFRNYHPSSLTYFGAFNSNGNLGIGTTNASYDLEVTGDVSFTAAKVKFIGGSSYNENIRMYAQSNGYSSIIMGAVAGDTGAGVGQWALVRYPVATDNHKFSIRHNTTDAVTITTGSSVGINDANPLNTAWGSDTVTKQLSISGSSYAVINLHGASGGTGRKYSIGVGDQNFYMAYDNTAGSHRIVVNNNGNVGINTTVPGFKLHVSNGDIAIGNNNQTSGDFSQAQALHFLNEGVVPLATIKAVRVNWAQGRTDLTLSNYDSGLNERVRIQYDGNVGINSTAPQYPLIVVGSTSAAAVQGIRNTSNSGYSGMHFISASGALMGHIGYANTATAAWTNQFFVGSIASIPLVFSVADSEKARITTGGSVGIGTNAPVAKLSVYTASPHPSPTGISVAAGAGGANLLARDGNYHNWLPFTDGNNYYSAGSHIFRNAAHTTDWVTIDSSGEVGIGTTAPQTLLHVYGASDAFSIIETGGGSYGYLRLKTPSSGNGYIIKNTGTGNSVLDKSLYLWNDPGPIQFITNGTVANAVTISGSGNLGIGTATPSVKLHVNGTSYIGTMSAYAPAVHIRGAYYGGPRLQVYGLDADANAWMGLGTDMSSAPYELSIYYSTNGASSVCFGKYDGTATQYGGFTPTARLSNAGTWTVAGDVVAYGSPSDITLKTNIKPLKGALDKITKLQGVSFTWKEGNDISKLAGLKDDLGFIAQDVQEVIPDLVRKNDNGLLSLRDKGITPLLVEAVKELKAQNDTLQSRIQQLESLLLSK